MTDDYDRATEAESLLRTIRQYQFMLDEEFTDAIDAYFAAHDQENDPLPSLDLITLRRACDALAALVRQEYPDGYSLAEIANTWGGEVCVTSEQVEALRLLEAGDVETAVERAPEETA